MAKYNRRCTACGKEYYCCLSCVGEKSWHNYYCGTDCYVQARNSGNLVDALNNANIIDKGETKMTIVNNSSRYIRVKGYDLDQGKFDGENGKTYVLEDIQSLIISNEEFKQIITSLKKAKEVKEEKPVQQVQQPNNFKPAKKNTKVAVEEE